MAIAAWRVGFAAPTACVAPANISVPCAGCCLLDTLTHLPLIFTRLLAGLETLSVVGFSRVPPALAAATSLTELRLGSTLYTTFQVGKRGVATLQQLPRLAMLRLPPLSDEDRRRVQRLLRDRPQLRAFIGKALRQHQTCCADD